MPAAESNLSKEWDWLKNWLGQKMVRPKDGHAIKLIIQIIFETSKQMLLFKMIGYQLWIL